MKTYKINTLCKNCGNRQKYEIEFGKTISWATCCNCGCNLLEYNDVECSNVINGDTNKSKKCK